MTPAETPTECVTCEPYMEPKMEVVPANIRMRYTGDLLVHARYLHFQLSEKDARIRELVAKVEQRGTELTAIYDWIQMNRERQFTETRAISAAHNPTALARSEGGGA